MNAWQDRTGLGKAWPTWLLRRCCQGVGENRFCVRYCKEGPHGEDTVDARTHSIPLWR